MMSMAPTAVIRPAENVSGYPARRIGGSIALPTVATVAALAPEMAPKIADVPTVVTPRLPGTRPTPACTKSTMRCATLPRDISSPA